MSDKPASKVKPGFLARVSLFGFVRWFFSWRIMRRWVFAGACLVTLLAVLIAGENWRGKQAWEKYKQEQEAKGEKFDLAAFIPPPVPDDENFVMTPFLRSGRSDDFARGLFTTDPKFLSERQWREPKQSDYNIWTNALTDGTKSPFTGSREAATALMQAFEKYRPVLDELQVASSQRPYCRFKEFDSYSGDPMGLRLPPLSLWKNLATVYGLRVKAELILGGHARALADVKTMFYLADTLKDQPDLLCGLVRIGLLHLAMQTAQGGLASHQWSEAELLELQKQLAGIDLLAEYGAVMRGERAYGVTGIGIYAGRLAKIAVFPRGWVYLNELALSGYYDQHIFPPIDAANHQVDAVAIDAGVAATTNEFKRGFHPTTMLAGFLAPALNNAPRKFAAAQVRLDEAVAACALERFHLAKGSYPEKLDELVPQFIKSVPRDVFNGEPLKYHRTDDGQFTLYSVGWNGKDDGGKSPEKKVGKVYDPNAGDWVWPANF